MAASDQNELAAQAAVFIDSDVPDLDALLAGLAPGETAFVLDSTSDGVQQIADIIAEQHLSGLSSISIVGHGAAGAIHLGSTTLDDDDLSSEAPALAQIGSALAPGGDLSLYACDVAEGATGQQFIANLSAYAGGVAVAAASHLVGAASGGGSWALDASAGGAPAVAAPFTAAALASYQGELAAPTFKFNGVNYVADIYGSFAAGDSLPQAVAANVNAIAVVADFGIDAENNTVYDNDVDGGYTESDDNIASTISKAVGLGLGVMVRPIIDFLPSNYNTDRNGTNPLNAGYSASEFRSYYNPGAAGSDDANSFFASYQTMIVGQAELAQANGASIFSIGVELDQIAGPSYLPYWTSIIDAVRAVYSGKLTYGADWDDSDSPWKYGNSGLAVGTGDITTQISFWNQLDYVGIDEYAPISDLADPTVAQLVAGWEQTPTDSTTLSVTHNQSLINYYQGVAAAIGKPLLFTEIGYANSSDAASSPATPGDDELGNPDNATADPTLQADLYTAFYQAWSQDGNGSLVGAYLWNWEPGGAGSSQFNVQGVAAQSAVTAGNAEGDSPAVTSIATTGPSANSATSETFAVTFSEAVTGLSASDFALATTNKAGGTALTTGGISGISGSGASYDVTVGGVSGDGTLALYFKANSTDVVDANNDAAMAGYTSGEIYTIDTPPCFCRGTRILTDHGEVAVENLAIGDRLITVSGEIKPITWIGRRLVDTARYPDPKWVWPICVSAGAFGASKPSRDLWLSPGHNIASEGALMPVSALQNGKSVRQHFRASVEYWHVELETHDVLLAEGLPAESYLDCGNRTDFSNGGAFVEAHPDFRPKHWADTCLPLVGDGPAVAATKARLLARLVEQGNLVDHEAGAHIVADAMRIEPIRLSETRIAFVLPAGSREIALRSKLFIPAHTRAKSADARELGLCIGRLQIDGFSIALEDEQACGLGWREVEREGGRCTYRWTNGATPLPSGARVVIVELAGAADYWSAAGVQAAAMYG